MTRSKTQIIEAGTTDTTSVSVHTSENNVLEFKATLDELRKTVDPQLVRQRPGRRDADGRIHTVEYVEWHTVADILDHHAPNWGHSIKDIRAVGDIITVTVAITIEGVTREGIGTGRLSSETGIKKAEHDALKRAAVKFGIARELYKRDVGAADSDDPARPPESRLATEDPVAKTLGELVTGKQLGMIRALARDANIDARDECNGVMKCSPDELSKRAASEFIEHLQNLQRNITVPIRRAG